MVERLGPGAREGESAGANTLEGDGAGEETGGEERGVTVGVNEGGGTAGGGVAGGGVAGGGYNPEYIYGNYFQWFKARPFSVAAVADARADVEKEEEEEEEKLENQGLRELIDSKDSADARILHRNINAASPSLTGTR